MALKTFAFILGVYKDAGTNAEGKKNAEVMIREMISADWAFAGLVRHQLKKEGISF